MTTMLLLAVLIVSPLTTTNIENLDGRWLRQGAPQVMPDYTEPEWQDLTVTTDTVTLIRAIQPTVIETYRTDGVERPANRVAPENPPATRVESQRGSCWSASIAATAALGARRPRCRRRKCGALMRTGRWFMS
jgi:hypothetical protein